ncbi:MAG TPA: tetratricopeptide repeat protein [Blastocatellia bacterium]|nr:tetratricopeptide repeat protein [Blastocatellia bacterium]
MQRLWKLLFVVLVTTAAILPVRADDLSAAFERGDQLVAMGQYEMAILHYRMVLGDGFGERVAKAHYNIGVCHHKLGRLNDAVTEYRAAIKARRDDYPKAAFALGTALKEMGDWKAAKEAFSQVGADATGLRADALFELGMIFAREGDYSIAAEKFRESIAQTDRRLPASHNNLGVLLALAGRQDEAEKEFELARKQSDGRLREATHNLKVCRSLRAKGSTQLLASLKITTQTHFDDETKGARP